MIYMDNAATTRPHKCVVDAVSTSMRKNFGNPSSVHSLGIEAEREMKKARESSARIINARESEIYFTSGGTEANNLAVFGAASFNSRKGKKIITSKLEHKSVLMPIEELKKSGFTIQYVRNDSSGNIDMSHMAELVDEETCMVSIMHVNNEIGNINDIYAISKIIKSKNSGAIFHVDAVQSFGKIKLDVRYANVDILCVSAHKIFGPKGIGFIFIKKGIKVKPIFYGGGQEKGMRSGTENMPGIAGFAGVCNLIDDKKIGEKFERVTAKRDMLLNYILGNLDFAKVIGSKEKSPYITSIAFSGIKAEVLVRSLEEKGVYISTGSACNAKQNEYSHVLNGLEISPTDKTGTVRISLTDENTAEDVIDGAKLIVESVLELSKFMRRNVNGI